MVSEVEWVRPRSLGSRPTSRSSCRSDKLLVRAIRDKEEPSQSLLNPDLRLSREGGVERDGVVGDEAVVESEGGVGEWWRGGEDL